MMTGLELICDGKLIEERDYWVHRLSECPEESTIRLDFERPEHYLAERSSEAVEVCDNLAQKLFKMAGNSDFLIYTTLLASWTICLNKHTGNKRMVVGSPALLDPERKDYQSNVLAILAEINEPTSFRELLMQLRETLLAAYARQRYPFNRVVKDIGLAEVKNRCALFDTLVVLENIHVGLPDLSNDLVLRLKKRGGQISGSLNYNSSLFRKERIGRLKGHFQNILRAGLEDSTRKVRDLCMLPQPERDYLLVWFNDTEVEHPAATNVHRLFEEQAEKTPDAIALVSGEEHLRYRELNERANRLAHYLIRLGVGPDVLVGVCIERSINMLVALLAILKAGGAYVPLDPSYPKQRLGYILQGSAMAVVLTERETLEQLPEGSFRIILMKEQWAEINRCGTGNPESGVKADNLAYVIYTSGSTGKPKGVMIPHRGVVNYLNWCKGAYNVEGGNGLPVHTSLGFDLTVTSLYSPLIVGTKCVLINEQEGIDGLGDELARSAGFSAVKLTPGHMEVLRQRMRAGSERQSQGAGYRRRGVDGREFEVLARTCRRDEADKRVRADRDGRGMYRI
jgi:non-ribosomal peptide synthetase component F